MIERVDSTQSENILMQLKEVQNECGYITNEHIEEISARNNVSVSEVYGIATFYSFLRLKPVGRNIIRMCRSLPCHLKDMEIVRECLSDMLGIDPGETTEDGRFSLVLTNCIGACDMAPAMLINSKLHGNVSIDKLPRILEEYK